MTALRAVVGVVVAATLAGCTASKSVSHPGGPAVTATTGAPPVSSPALEPTTGATTSTVLIRPVTPATAATGPTTPRPPDRSPAFVLLTSADNVRTIAVRVGDTVKLLLDDPTMKWSGIMAAPDHLLAPAPAPAPPPHGAVGIWNAVAPGTVTITAVGTAWCAAGNVCPLFAELFKITLVIS